MLVLMFWMQISAVIAALGSMWPCLEKNFQRTFVTFRNVFFSESQRKSFLTFVTAL